MTRRTYVVFASALILVIFVAANTALSRWLSSARIDLTGNGLYTLSDSADEVVRRLVEPVELEFVYARNAAGDYPGIQSHAARVRELLREIETRAAGKVIIRETNPAPFSAEEDRVSLAGLTAVQESGDALFLGVIGRNSVDDLIVIPFLSPPRDAFLEYDLVRLIAQLDDPAPPVVALLSGLPGFQGDGGSAGDAFILKEMSRQFQVRPLSPDFEGIPEDTDILMMVNPPMLDEARQYQIDRFLRTNGRALIALDPASLVAAASGAMRQTSSSLGLLTEALGVRLAPSVVADPVLALPVEIDAGAGRRSVVGQPLFISVPKALMAADDPVTGDLTRPINFGAAGALEFAGGTEGLSFERLVESTAEAMTAPAEFAVRGPDPRAVFESMAQPAETKILAARVSGRLKDTFAIAPPDSEENRLELSVIEAPLPATADIIVVADSDFLADGFHLDPSTGEPIADNAALVLNALDNLAGGSALGALRSRAPATRPMTQLDEMRQEAQARLFEEQTALQTQLERFEARLAELDKATPRNLRGAGERTLASDPEMAELREQILEARSQLREIEGRYRADINRVEATLVALNIWLMPVLIVLLGIGAYLWRSRDRLGRQ